MACKYKYVTIGIVLLFGCDSPLHEQLPYSIHDAATNNYHIRKNTMDYQLALCYDRIRKQDTWISIDIGTYLRNCTAELGSSMGDMANDIIN